jgi:CheY-like chemotaxis protein
MTWDDQIGQVRKQITELRTALAQNEKIVETTKLAVEEARQKVEQLLVQPANSREALYQLPLVLEAVTNNKLIGTVLFGQDGKVIMHNGTVQRALGIDPVTSRLPSGVFSDGRSGELLTDEQLPWARCMRGFDSLPSMRLTMKRADVQEELHLEVSTISLRNDRNVSGVVALFMDLTETIKADQYIKKLCHSLEKHMSGIEEARRELRFLTDKLGQNPEEPAPAINPINQPSSGTHKTVLVADDIPVNQKLLIMHLKKWNVEYEIANNGLEAVDMCKNKQFGLILMDCDMPILNGFEATERIRQMDAKKGLHTPIVAMTSYDRVGDKEKCLQSGMDDYLPKGVSKDRLRDIVDHFVFGKQVDLGTPAPKESISLGKQAQLDIDSLRETLGDETEQVVSSFFGSTATLLNCLQFAIEEQDAQAVNHFAFSLKGPCASLGLSVMARFAAELTADAEHGRWVEAQDVYQSLLRMFKALRSQAGSTVDRNPYAAFSK